MNDKKWIIIGLLIFVGLFTFPLWSNLGNSTSFPEVELATKAKEAKECILPAEEMRAGHMKILDEWRVQVVREGIREYTAPNGKKYEMSLSNTCLDCHSNREQFCNRCHNYVNVTPYCWDCHVDPNLGLKEMMKWKTTEENSSK